MKKRIMAGMLAIAVLAAAYSLQGIMMGQAAENSEISEAADASETDAAGNQEKQSDALEIGREIEPLVSEKIDTSKQGVAVSLDVEYFSEMTKGDDGSCYYFRNRGKGKIVFYKDNGVKVCEVANKYLKKEYYIVTFAKYGDHFFVALRDSSCLDYILTAVDIATGQWGKSIKTRRGSVYENLIIYENRFYCISRSTSGVGDITIYSLSGKKTVIDDLGSRPWVQCIVDDKIYYYTCEHEDAVTKIMRCSLDGNNKETLFQCEGDICKEMLYFPYPENIRIDGNSIFFLTGGLGSREGFNLICLPLYGGKIEGVADKVTGWYELSEDSIFFYRSSEFGGKIYKLDKNLGGKPEVVTKAYKFQREFYSYARGFYPFHYANGHLMVHGYNKKQRKVVDALWGNEYIDDSLWIDVLANYIDDYYWVSEDGEVEATIKGSGVKKKWRKSAKKYL